MSHGPYLPSGKLIVCYGKSPFFHGKNPLLMAIIAMLVYQRVMLLFMSKIFKVKICKNSKKKQ